MSNQNEIDANQLADKIEFFIHKNKKKLKILVLILFFGIILFFINQSNKVDVSKLKNEIVDEPFQISYTQTESLFTGSEKIIKKGEVGKTKIYYKKDGSIYGKSKKCKEGCVLPIIEKRMKGNYPIKEGVLYAKDSLNTFLKNWKEGDIKKAFKKVNLHKKISKSGFQTVFKQNNLKLYNYDIKSVTPNLDYLDGKSVKVIVFQTSEDYKRIKTSGIYTYTVNYVEEREEWLVEPFFPYKMRAVYLSGKGEIDETINSSRIKTEIYVQNFLFMSNGKYNYIRGKIYSSEQFDGIKGAIRVKYNDSYETEEALKRGEDGLRFQINKIGADFDDDNNKLLKWNFVKKDNSKKYLGGLKEYYVRDFELKVPQLNNKSKFEVSEVKISLSGYSKIDQLKKYPKIQIKVDGLRTF